MSMVAAFMSPLHYIEAHLIKKSAVIAPNQPTLKNEKPVLSRVSIKLNKVEFKQ